MARYFFHIENGSLIRDEDGEMVASDAAACAVGLQVLSEMIPGNKRGLEAGEPLSVHIEREDIGCFLTLQATARPYQTQQRSSLRSLV